MYQKEIQMIFFNPGSTTEQLCWPGYIHLLLWSVCLSAYQNGPWGSPHGFSCSREPRSPGEVRVGQSCAVFINRNSPSLDPLGSQRTKAELAFPHQDDELSYSLFCALFITYKCTQCAEGHYKSKMQGGNPAVHLAHNENQ